MNTKTALRYYLTPVGITFIKKSDSVGEDGGLQFGALLQCWWECELVQHIWKQQGIFSEK